MAFKKSVNFVIQLLVALILFFIIQIPSLFARPLNNETIDKINICLLYTSPSPRD